MVTGRGGALPGGPGMATPSLADATGLGPRRHRLPASPDLLPWDRVPPQDRRLRRWGRLEGRLHCLVPLLHHLGA